MNEYDVQAEIIPLGRISSTYAIKGEFMVTPYAINSLNLTQLTSCFLLPKANYLHKKLQAPTTLHIKNSKKYKDGILFFCEEFNNPEQVKPFMGSEIGIYRNDLPALNEEEYYWIDLIGKTVVNKENQVIGIVKSMMDNGVQSILCIHNKENPKPSEEILILFTAKYILEVKEQIIVDWEL